MSKYYLLSGLLIDTIPKIHGFGKNPTIKEKIKAYNNFFKKDIQNNTVPVTPKNYTFIKLSKAEAVEVVTFDFDVGNFLIKANSRESAYNIMNIILGFHLLYRNVVIEPDTSIYRLQEINKIPQYIWTAIDVINALDKKIHYWYGEAESYRLKSGFGVFDSTFKELKIFLECFYKDNDSRESLEHLIQSAQVFDYFPNSSYYHAHYSRDVKLESKAVYRKKYFEDKITYETAFLAAFKGIERFFRVTQIKENNLNRIFRDIPYNNITPKTKYKRYFEIFLGYKRNISYLDLIDHFLDLRNITAAHGNKKIQKEYLINEFNIFEIQLFLTNLINEVFIQYKLKN